MDKQIDEYRVVATIQTLPVTEGKVINYEIRKVNIENEIPIFVGKRITSTPVLIALGTIMEEEPFITSSLKAKLDFTKKYVKEVENALKKPYLYFNEGEFVTKEKLYDLTRRIS